MNLVSNCAMSKALGDTRRAFIKGNKRFIKYPAAWAIAHLERQFPSGQFNVIGEDGVALAYLQWLQHAVSRWRHHPLFPQVSRGLVDEFHHSLSLLTIASYLSDHGNPIGFTNTKAAIGKSPDLYINVGPTSRLSIEIKAPNIFHWPECVPTFAQMVRSIEAQAKAARNQITGESGGVLVIGAFHLDRSFDAMFDEAIKIVMLEKKVSKRIAAITGISFSSINVNTNEQGDYSSDAQCSISVKLNPRFAGQNPVKV